MADGRRLRRLEVGVVGRERRAGGACVTGERGGLVDERVVQLARAGTSRQPKRDAERLAPRAAGAQPPRGRSSDTSLELGLAGVERVAEGRVPRELVAGDRVELEQAAQERLRVLAAEVAALDERDRMREIGERQPAREPRPVRALSRVGRCHELARSAAPETATPPQLLGLGHRGRLALPACGSTRRGSTCRVASLCIVSPSATEGGAMTVIDELLENATSYAASFDKARPPAATRPSDRHRRLHGRAARTRTASSASTRATRT